MFVSFYHLKDIPKEVETRLKAVRQLGELRRVKYLSEWRLIAKTTIAL